MSYHQQNIANQLLFQVDLVLYGIAEKVKLNVLKAINTEGMNKSTLPSAIPAAGRINYLG
jgi:hypothetical protein